MFDYLLCEYPLPDTAPKWITEKTLWQTKDTDAQYMENYTITKEGRLIHHSVLYENVPENERPYWGKPEWETSKVLQLCGCIRSVPNGDIDTNHHGDLHIGAMSGSQPYVFYDLIVRFTNGRVEWIKEVKEVYP
jgi:hypothetical protein